MIIPSIDLMGGQAVQLIGGKEKALDAGNPVPIAERFQLAGEIAVVDLDAALGQGSNADLVERLVEMAPCRVGGGIRDDKTAVRWLDAGASKVILGTAARPEILRRLPKDRVIAALDALDGEVVVDGWQTLTGQTVERRMTELRGVVGGFLVTFVESEGRQQGINMDRVRRVVAASDVRVTVAGGVTTSEEVAEIDRLGADAQVGMALYSGAIDLGEAIVAPMITDRPDGLWPTVVVDEQGIALGLTYSDRESVREAVSTRAGVYHSRSRGLWVKGETSGDRQVLLRVDLDCDRDALRFTVRQEGSGFCHQGMRTCWGPDHGLSALLRTLASRLRQSPEGSYTKRLLGDPAMLRSKLIEEASELADALDSHHVASEAADLIYFALVALARGGSDLAEVEEILDRRSRRVTRRAGDAKE
jgi:phosphoribosyl-ATP pyrophosphohydrolase/phosphoribosyl-AMP cyclohydrolase